MKENLQTIAARIEERQKTIADDVKDIKVGFKEHADKDDKRFGAIDVRFSSLNKYLVFFGATCLFIGWAAKSVLAG